MAKKLRFDHTLSFLGTDIAFTDISYSEVPARPGVPAFMRIERYGKRVKVIKTEGFLGGYTEDEQHYEFTYLRNDDPYYANELVTANGSKYSLTVYTVVNTSKWYYYLEEISKDTIRVSHSEDFLSIPHTQILGYRFTREVFK